MSIQLPLPRLNAGGTAELDSLLEEKIQKGSVPSIFWGISNAKETIYENQAGYNVMGEPSSGKVNRDSTLEIYSMTKLVVTVAILQLVERGILELDDEDVVYDKLPELGTQKVFEGYDEHDQAILVPQTTRITIRMLLNHTSGTTTAQRNGLLQKWYHAQPDPAPGGLTSGASIESIICPLMFQPGTSWQYSSGTDWLGVLVSRISGMTLEDYLRTEVFEKVDGGMPDTTFYPRQDILDRKVGIYQRLQDGTLKRYPICSDGRASTVDDVSKTFLAGSGGLFGTTKDYLAFLRAILQSNPRYPSPPQLRLLSPQSYELLFTTSLNAVQKEKAAELCNRLNVYSPTATAQNVDHSLGLPLILEESSHGRKAGSGSWYGMARTQFWIDPASGVAAVCNTQIIGPDPEPWNKVYTDFERAVYDELITK